MPKTRLLISAAMASLFLQSGSLFAAPSQQAGDIPLLLASSVDPDFPSGLEHEQKSTAGSQRAPARSRKQTKNKNSSTQPAQEYAPTPNNTADPDWPKQLGSPADAPQQERSSPGAEATNQGPSSIDPNWRNKAD